MTRVGVLFVMGLMGCVDEGQVAREEVDDVTTHTLAFDSGVPDPGSTWTLDAQTGGGNLVGAVNFPMPVAPGEALPLVLTQVTDNANTCTLCADGNSVAMMYVVYRGSTFEVLSHVITAGRGLEEIDGVGATYTVKAGDAVVVRFSTLFVLSPLTPRTSRIRPLTYR